MNSIAARMVYENALQSLRDAFADNPEGLKDTRPLQSYLRVELPLVAGDTAYNFNLLTNEGAAFNTERRLKLQHSFVVSEIGIFLGAPSGATDTTFRPVTYPNTQLFPVNFAAMQGFYNGSLNIMVDNVRYLDSWDLWRHYDTNETQQTAPLGAGSPGDQFCGKEDGFYPMEPNIVFIGSKDSQIQITLPTGGLTAVDANSRAIIIFRGILAQNSTSVQ